MNELYEFAFSVWAGISLVLLFALIGLVVAFTVDQVWRVLTRERQTKKMLESAPQYARRSTDIVSYK